MKEEEEQKREGDKEPLVEWNPDRDLELSSTTTCSSSSNSLIQNGQHIRKASSIPVGIRAQKPTPTWPSLLLLLLFLPAITH
jgi:hypothetical protein